MFCLCHQVCNACCTRTMLCLTLFNHWGTHYIGMGIRNVYIYVCIIFQFALYLLYALLAFAEHVFDAGHQVDLHQWLTAPSPHRDTLPARVMHLGTFNTIRSLLTENRSMLGLCATVRTWLIMTRAHPICFQPISRFDMMFVFQPLLLPVCMTYASSCDCRIYTHSLVSLSIGVGSRRIFFRFSLDVFWIDLGSYIVFSANLLWAYL